MPEIIQPYKHDCSVCVWVGWLHLGNDNGWGNVYICGKTVVIRHSDEPSDYWSMNAGSTKPHALEIPAPENVDHLYDDDGNLLPDEEMRDTPQPRRRTT